MPRLPSHSHTGAGGFRVPSAAALWACSHEPASHPEGPRCPALVGALYNTEGHMASGLLCSQRWLQTSASQ